ncbi:uncharacterized protein APUU_21110S [Aspergillus puulaauensis]|uniref:Uncharacterized protein n=1 Tax=Aspergillus puulaauensis TaxID=1220207 RepID=A0A7R8AKN1_9EURO|nr:uncharacterized protein APUU_21110S [Aspergillus puulaauensis]BCS20678.1 hypothetical protein APUU_21110S [Aspergillus puulaauensis]
MYFCSCWTITSTLIERPGFTGTLDPWPQALNAESRQMSRAFSAYELPPALQFDSELPKSTIPAPPQKTRNMGRYLCVSGISQARLWKTYTPVSRRAFSVSDINNSNRQQPF